MSDPYKHYASTPQAFGTLGDSITPNDSTDLDPFPKAVVVTSVAGGSVLSVLPIGNADGEWVSFTGVTVGYMPPFRVRRVAAATTCSVASVNG